MYYFPGLNGNTISDAVVKQRIVECGLDTILGDLKGDERLDQATTSGPDGSGGGLVVAVRPVDGGDSPNTGYYPEHQQWVHIKPKGYWIGLVAGSPLRPIDVQRPKIFRDYEVVLADGNAWSVMTLLPFAREGSIPRIGQMSDECEWLWVTHPKYRELQKRYESLAIGDGQDIDVADLAVETLAVNYRLNKYLAMMAGLLEADHCRLIIDMGMDEPAWLADQEAKKRGIDRSGGSLTNSGAPTPPVSPVIDQPTLTSSV
jgi:hypothetical protein